MQWGIELLVEGGNRLEHLKRFDDAYAALRIPREHTRVIEFRSGASSIRMPPSEVDNDRFMAVTFSPDCRSAKVQTARFERQVVLTALPPASWH